ncbi:dTDP-4-amino-4,6-dideoxy-D-glucose transaminase [Sphaerisporangium melleum]|uniref:dTDP-4-amino-4,6-dideoxy-D-glucose transaminase n=1 Tax=Sphaerisporangium melleum TaxID=321316 RepID=A0A917QU78_9ACTN|nr:dTDP-4-amino-4,6-dideoxygalactose transaminase [Sphaerisporangium melleum]GGK67408.1 dTDP-4-amino-4,6-dideoxy-D-glucose transaminase [Sphaerisporangium melleum]GII68480.1 dTDP-4-amino-4,6-dideoxy-D-glucose transaminase [Sphaerisporangium melleum]
MRVTTSELTPIPFNRTYVAENQHEYVLSAMHGKWASGYGRFNEQATDLIRKISGAEHAVLTTSGSTALDLAAFLVDVEPGDEVLVPSYTFVAVANVWAVRGAVPVFVDCRPDTLNIDEEAIEAAITSRTRAIVAMHYGGVACEMTRLVKIAERYDLALVEDNAHGFGASYHGRPLGTFGNLAALSFHASKNVQCGEGGGVMLPDAEIARRADIARENGTNRREFFRGQVDKYRWIEKGANYMLAELLAAQLTAQLEAFDEIQRQRHEVWRFYDEELADWAAANGVARPGVPDGCDHAAHLYYLLLPDLASREGMIAHLARHGVQAHFHYMPLHNSVAGLRFGRVAPDGCPVAESVSDRLIRLPLYAGLTEGERERVVRAVTGYRVR